MKLKDLMEKYGEYEVNSKCVVGECEIERIVIDLTKPKPKTVWDLEENDGFFVLTSDGKILYYKFGCYNNHEIECGSAFLTYTEAEQNLERRKVEALLLKHGGRRWFKQNGENWNIELRFVDNGLLKNCAIRHLIQGGIYFDTEEQAQKAIEQIGDGRIKTALFEVR